MPVVIGVDVSVTVAVDVVGCDLFALDEEEDDEGEEEPLPPPK
jgi:hypothetical protein